MTAATATSTAESSVGSLTGRCAFAAANALMAAVVGSLTLGIWAGVAGALVLGLLPMMPFMPAAGRAVFEWVVATPVGAALAGFLLFWIVGTIVWGLIFAFGIALFLVPVMLGIVVFLTLGRPVSSSGH